MALVRLALIALVACGRAGAQPSTASGIAVPAGWTALPGLATSVSAAVSADGVTVDGAEAWGETARGCYAVWFRIHGAGATADAVLAGLATEKLVTSDVVKPEGDGIISARFAKGVHTGQLRARIADGTITALACFANQREPKSCASPCTTLLGALP